MGKPIMPILNLYSIENKRLKKIPKKFRKQFEETKNVNFGFIVEKKEKIKQHIEFKLFVAFKTKGISNSELNQDVVLIIK